jgi:hypothetical protein
MVWRFDKEILKLGIGRSILSFPKLVLHYLMVILLTFSQNNQRTNNISNILLECNIGQQKLGQKLKIVIEFKNQSSN